MDEIIRKRLEELLPPLVRASDLEKLTGGLLSTNLLARAEYFHHPHLPLPKRYLGSRVVYDREELMDWLERYYGEFNGTTKHGKGLSRKVFTGAGTARSSGGAGEGAASAGGRAEGHSD